MNLETTFCMDSGQVRTGEDKDDTFIKMLQEVVRITPPIAYGIASEYPSVMSLVEAFRRNGPNILEDLRVCSPIFCCILAGFVLTRTLEIC